LDIEHGISFHASSDANPGPQWASHGQDDETLSLGKEEKAAGDPAMALLLSTMNRDGPIAAARAKPINACTRKTGD
jgi:hypothetical protein